MNRTLRQKQIVLAPTLARDERWASPRSWLWLRATLGAFAAAFTLLGTAAVEAQSCAVPGADGPATISGVVNTYYSPIPGIYSGGTIPFATSAGAPTPIAPGDLVLVIQMQCADIDSSNSPAYGAGGSSTTGRGYTDPASGCLAGRYEFVRAEAGSSGSQLVAPLQFSYEQNAGTVPNRRTFQVIRVPQYSSVTIGGTVTAPYWNGATGGVVAIDVAGELNWAGGTIDVAGRGFRGGVAPDQSGFSETGAAPYVSNNPTPRHGGKGEGIAGTPRYVWNASALTPGMLDNGATWGATPEATLLVAHLGTQAAAVTITTAPETTPVVVAAETRVSAVLVAWGGEALDGLVSRDTKMRPAT